jgi:hypothetical protein
MSSPVRPAAGERAADRAAEIRAACALIASLREGDPIDDAGIQAVLGQAVRLYAERAAGRDEPFAAFAADAGVTATDAMVAVTAILKAVNLQLFELGMWQAWSGRC